MFEELLTRIAQSFSRAGIPYMVIGGQALLRYGEPRLTKDIDITLGISPRQAEPALAVIADLKFKILVDDVPDFLARTFVLPVLDPVSGIRIDLIFALSDYEQAALARAAVFDLNGTPVRFITPEDLVIHKIVAGRPRDIEDVKNLLLKVKSLEHQEVRRWLREYDVAIGESFELRFEEILRSLA